MNESTTGSHSQADGHHHNGSAIVDATKPQETKDAAKATHGNPQGTIADLAAMATGLASKVEALANLAKNLAQKATMARAQEPAPVVDGGGQKAKQGALSNEDAKTDIEKKSPANDR